MAEAAFRCCCFAFGGFKKLINRFVGWYWILANFLSIYFLPINKQCGVRSYSFWKTTLATVRSVILILVLFFLFHAIQRLIHVCTHFKVCFCVLDVYGCSPWLERFLSHCSVFLIPFTCFLSNFIKLTNFRQQLTLTLWLQILTRFLTICATSALCLSRHFANYIESSRTLNGFTSIFQFTCDNKKHCAAWV